MDVLVGVGFGAVVIAWLVGWWRAVREIRSVPEGAFVALGSSRSEWRYMVGINGVIAVPLYYVRFRRPLLRAAEHATDLAPAWYPDQNDPALERWFDGRAWTDLRRERRLED